MSAGRGFHSGDGAEPNRQASETTAQLGEQVVSSSSGLAPNLLGSVVVPSCQAQTLERRRRYAPWASSAARESKRARPSLANAICVTSPDEQMSCSLNSLKGGYMGDYIRSYYRGY